MDAKTESGLSPSFHNLIKDTLSVLRGIQWFPHPEWPQRFSVQEVINSLNEVPLYYGIITPLKYFRYPGISIPLVVASLLNPNPSDLKISLIDIFITKTPSPVTEYQSLGLSSETLYQKMVKISPENFAQNPTERKIEQRPSTQDILFKDYSPGQKSMLEGKIAEQVKTYKTSVPGRTDTVITNWQSTIDAILQRDVKPSEFEFWRNLMAAVIYVESGGAIGAVSIAGAVGPAQMTRSTAEAVAKKHGIFNIDPTNGWTSIRLSRFLLGDLMQRYGRIDLALAAYYGGQNFADRFILSALAGRNVDKEDSIMKKGISSKAQLQSYINYYGINITNLGSSDGEEYFIKTVAALNLLDEERGLKNIP